MAESKADLKALCRGNRTDRGWENTEEGLWTPSVHDRRRVAVAHVHLLAEMNQAEAVPGEVVLTILALHSNSAGDHAAMIENFSNWLKGPKA